MIAPIVVPTFLMLMLLNPVALIMVVVVHFRVEVVLIMVMVVLVTGARPVHLARLAPHLHHLRLHHSRVGFV